MSLTFKFLGTGTSVGVPQIGCDCPVCTSADPRDKRRRCGAYVASGDSAFLIDTPPELREACIQHSVKKVDAVLLTHAHMDHIAAFDDIRRFNTINGEVVKCDPASPGANGRTVRVIGKVMKCYALPETIVSMRSIFPYISTQGGTGGLYRPQVEFVENTAPFSIGGTEIEAFRVEHGFPCCGYVFTAEDGKRLAYISDCHDIPDDVVEKIAGVEILVLNCLRVREHPTHLSLERALGYISRISPGKAYLTHLCHDLKYTDWLERLPEGVEPAYDGLELSL